MSYASQVLGGSTTTKSIINAYSVAGWVAESINVVGVAGTKIVLSGALIANTLATVFSKTDGPCEFSQLYFETVDSTARTMRVKVTVDGVVAFDYTSASISTAQNGCCLAGMQHYLYSVPMSPIRSAGTILIEIASNLTETNKFKIGYSAQELN